MLFPGSGPGVPHVLFSQRMQARFSDSAKPFDLHGGILRVDLLKLVMHRIGFFELDASRQIPPSRSHIPTTQMVRFFFGFSPLIWGRRIAGKVHIWPMLWWEGLYGYLTPRKMERLAPSLVVVVFAKAKQSKEPLSSYLHSLSSWIWAIIGWLLR